MVQIIAGKKGKGKTKHLLDMANAAIKGANGTVVYLDKSAQHMYELNRYPYPSDGTGKAERQQGAVCPFYTARWTE